LCRWNTSPCGCLGESESIHLQRDPVINGVCSGFWRHSSLWCVTYLGHKLAPGAVTCGVHHPRDHLPRPSRFTCLCWDLQWL
jgi:hypothetical protein